MRQLMSFGISSWQDAVEQNTQKEMIQALETGKVVFLPQLNFELQPQEKAFLDPAIVAANTKNVSFNYLSEEIRGTALAQTEELKAMLKRFAESSRELINHLFPHYVNALEIGRTSLRPVEAAGRKSPSYRKDDTRLHVDAFPATPNQGRRLLRVFSNINPDGKPRIWRLGEAFEKVAEKFLPQIKPPFPGSSWLLETLKITKGCRTAYDHYMLQIHDRMKADLNYQSSVPAEEMRFPANSTWIVFTDQASHAALAGQHMLEQTFYLPVEAMAQPAASPLKILERLLDKKLDSNS